jgi:hypothetical protein
MLPARLGIVATLLLCISFSLTVNAQKLGFEETLSYINSKLGSEFKVTVERGVIISFYYEGGNRLYREDQINPVDVDTNKISYDANEKLFCIYCLGGKSKCVDRNLYVSKISRSYARVSYFVTLDPKSAEGLKKAFRHLVRLATIHNYKNNDPFE